MRYYLLFLLTLSPYLLLTGCSAPKTTDTGRSAIEQKLITTVVERGLAKVDFSSYKGKKVYLDYSNLNTQIDQKYVQGILDLFLSEHGVFLVEKPEDSEFTIQVLSGVLATDQNKILIGTPQLPVPIPDTSISLVVPEIAIFSKLTRIAYARFSFNILKTDGGIPVETISGINASAEYNNWVVILVPFTSHNLITEELEKVPTQFFFNL